MPNPDAIKDTQSVLAMMTSTVMDQKAQKRTTLTPVSGEARLPDVPQVFLTNEALADVARDLRRQAQLLIDVAEGLEGITGTTPAPSPLLAVVEREEQKLRERAADLAAAARQVGDTTTIDGADEPDVSSFAANYAAQQQAAQAATFGKPPVSDGWVCPDHGKGEPTVSPKGRHFRKCPDCSKFEK